MVKQKWTIGRILKTVWVVAGIAFTLWIWNSFQAKKVSPGTLKSNNLVTVVQTEDFIAFTPSTGFKKTLIFFPGALVDPKAYGPLCTAIAHHGIKTVIIKMPFRLSTIGYEKPKNLNFFADTSKEYILSGHSQGAKMAARFVFENPGLIDRLILIGTTHPRDINLSGINIPVMKLYGTHDGVASAKNIIKNKAMLPASTEYVVIEGGNHSQFGYYGHQFNDRKATISREKQHDIIVQHVLRFIE